MGFGILFLGYFIATVAGILFPGIAGFFGFILMAFATLKLSEYHNSFRIPMIACAIAAVVSAFIIPNDISVFAHFSFPSWYTGALTYADGVREAVKTVFHLTVCLALRDIARETGEEKIVFSSVRNAVFYGIYYLIQIIILIPAFSEGARYLVPVALLLYFVILFMFHVMFFSAYMRICDESDVNMEIKKTNIGWFDRLNAMRAENEQKAADETTAFFQKRFDRMNEKNKRENAAASNGAKKKKHKK